VHSRYLRYSCGNRPSCPRHAGDPPAASRSLALPERRLRAANLHRASLQGLRRVRTTDQVIQRNHRCGVSCPGKASWPALHDHTRADVKIGAVKTVGIAPKLRQNRSICKTQLGLQFNCKKPTSKYASLRFTCNRQPTSRSIGLVNSPSMHGRRRRIPVASGTLATMRLTELSPSAPPSARE
jgi:hypothetical protein